MEENQIRSFEKRKKEKGGDGLEGETINV